MPASPVHIQLAHEGAETVEDSESREMDIEEDLVTDELGDARTTEDDLNYMPNMEEIIEELSLAE